jgi:hypothetical protein
MWTRWGRGQSKRRTPTADAAYAAAEGCAGHGDSIHSSSSSKNGVPLVPPLDWRRTPRLCRTAVALIADARRGPRSPAATTQTLVGPAAGATPLACCGEQAPVPSRPPVASGYQEARPKVGPPKAVSQLPFRAAAVNTAAGSESTPGCVRSPPLRSSGRSAVAPQVGWTSATNSIPTQGTNDVIYRRQSDDTIHGL